MSNASQYVTLACGEALFAVPVERVQEILDARPIARLPRAPSQLLGLIDVRGEGVAVADLRAMLGLEPQQDTEATRIIVLWLWREGGQMTIALRTDRVIEVTDLDSETLNTVPEGQLFNWDERLIAGIGRRLGQFVTVLDLDGMFAGMSLQGAMRAA